ncbi:hypothetical protein G3488_01140 [Shewanella baltica]|uniref:hypothetical protein n=1 Tax=Shewanella baltica TaxID=62322 RepID=UPI00217D2EBE|nr:hypothetical protein [Shewanella baltica]MCS6229492.1 hypothetical protein [Shewanella baltica]
MKTQIESKNLTLRQINFISRAYRNLAVLVFTLIASFSPLSIAATYQMSTPANDDGQGNFLFLDRHHVDCGVNAMSSLHLFRPSLTEIAYEYQCTEMGNDNSTNVFTTDNDDGGGNVIYLDRHTINCENKGLQYLHLERPTASTARYNYRCGNQTLSNVTDYFTAADDDGAGNAVFLDRHNVSCPNNKVLSYLRLERPTSNTIRYHYKCGTYSDATVHGFTGAFAPAHWSISGVAASSMSSSALTAVVNSGGGGVTASITIPVKGTINFDWMISIYSAGQYGDVIKYLINGVSYNLSTAGSASGSAQGIEVNTGDLFELLTWGTTRSSSYSAKFDNFSFVPLAAITPQCAFAGDNQGRNDAGFTGQTFVYSNTSYGTNRFIWDGINKGEVPIGTGSVIDENGNVFTLGAQVSHPYADLWYYEICVNMP